jgi:RNA polymerase sigma-70 factor (ECF subfamily)
LFRRHRARVIAWCYRLTGDSSLAPDLAQDVFVKAYSSLDMFRRDSKFTTWLYVIARNRCRDEQRARATRPREAPEDAMLDAPSDRNDALAALEARDARTVVRTMMDEVLDETEKRVMTLHYGHDMRIDAITTALGLTNTSGAKAYIVSAKRKLNAAVKRWNLKS